MTKIRIHSRLSELDRDQWQALRHSRYPFLDYDFLLALESSGSIGQETGWLPYYIVAYNDTESDPIEWIVPAFIKTHSYGEYVFDWSWAEAYQHHGLAYYPKLLCAVPFTPSTGPRLLHGPNTSAEQLWPNITALLDQLCEQQSLSGWHINFLPTTHALAITDEQHQPAMRHGCQFHWHNRGYTDFDHYLDTFTSRKRKSVRKERQKITQQGIQIHRKTGTEISTDDIEFFYQCYQMTYAQRRSRGYLNVDFFRQLLRDMSSQMLLVLAHDNDTPVAAALYFFDEHCLYGRYWGSLVDADALHFEACYYQGIEFCIERKLTRFDPGTQGEHKISRGFEPITTYSLHRLQHSDFHHAVHDFVHQEQQHIAQYQQQARSLLPFKID